MEILLLLNLLFNFFINITLQTLFSATANKLIYKQKSCHALNLFHDFYIKIINITPTVRGDGRFAWNYNI